jgi:hypothetical protein
MAERTNGKVQCAAARLEVPAKLNDADALKLCHTGREEFNIDFCHGLSGGRQESNGERQSLDPAGGLG